MKKPSGRSAASRRNAWRHGDVTYGHLRSVLQELGFEETRRSQGVALKHADTDTVFLFRPYADHDSLTSAEVFIVSKMLDEKGLLEPESFQALLAKAPA